MAGSVSAEVAAQLLERKNELARAIADALYAAMPELLEKYGERGRGKCLEDMRYNLEHLAPAVAMEEPALFGRYAVWLREMLNAHGVAGDEVPRCIELTRDVIRVHMGADAEAAAAPAIDAALRELRAP